MHHKPFRPHMPENDEPQPRTNPNVGRSTQKPWNWQFGFHTNPVKNSIDKRAERKGKKYIRRVTCKKDIRQKQLLYLCV